MGKSFTAFFWERCLLSFFWMCLYVCVCPMCDSILIYISFFFFVQLIRLGRLLFIWFAIEIVVASQNGLVKKKRFIFFGPDDDGKAAIIRLVATIIIVCSFVVYPCSISQNESFLLSTLLCFVFVVFFRDVFVYGATHNEDTDF